MTFYSAEAFAKLLNYAEENKLECVGFEHAEKLGYNKHQWTLMVRDANILFDDNISLYQDRGEDGGVYLYLKSYENPLKKKKPQ